METDRAELSALATSLDELTARITALADRHRRSPQADVADALYEVERSLLTAARKLDRVVRSLR
jgi:predicted transcriptional regulator